MSSSGLVWWLGWCGHAWQESPSRRARTGAGCPVCTGERTRPGINDLATTDPGLAARWDRWAAVRVPELTSRDVNADCGWLRRMLADQHAATDGSGETLGGSERSGIAMGVAVEQPAELLHPGLAGVDQFGGQGFDEYPGVAGDPRELAAQLGT